MVGTAPVRPTAPPALGAVLLLAGCAGRQTPLAPAGMQAGATFDLFTLMLLVGGAAYGAVLLFLAIAMWRASQRPLAEPQLEPADPGLRAALWLWGAAVVTGLVVLAGGSFVVERALASARTRETLLVRVTAHQWWWRIAYRDPASGAWIETANELHLPVDLTARIELGSSDVIHSFWVPNVAGKMDVVPGRRNALDVTPRRIGWFRGQCAEFCGAQHAHMALDVKVDSAADFAAWLAAQARPATAPRDSGAARGLAVITTGPCGLCHVVRGTRATGRAGPDLTHLASRRSVAAGLVPMSRGAVQGWIAQPQALKPGTMMPAVSLSAADADAVSHYLVGLK